MPKPSPAHIRSPEACEILGISVASLARWVHSGYLPTVRLGRRGVEPHIFDRATVQALADRRAAAYRTLNWKNPEPAAAASA